MVFSRLVHVNAMRKLTLLLLKMPTTSIAIQRSKTYFKSGAVRPMPKVLPFGMVSVLGSVIPGLFIGAAISKSVANFLEENELFVPSDDDDDDD